MELVMRSVSSTLGTLPSVAVALSVCAFAYSTVICWYYYGTECISALTGLRLPIFSVFYSGAVFLGGVVGGEVLVFFTDALMIILTVLTVWVLIKNSDRVVTLSESGGVISPRRNIKGILSLIREKHR